MKGTTVVRRAGLGRLTACSPWKAIFLSAAIVYLGVADPAEAGTVAKDGTVLRWTGDVAADSISVQEYPSLVRLIEQGGITAGSGCTQQDAETADCDVLGVTSTVLDAGDGADIVSCDGDPCTVNGQGEGDTLTSSGFGGATLDGGTGNDVLNGSVFVADVLKGGAGNDSLSGDGRGDSLDGGPGDDLLKPGDGQGLDNGDVVAGGDGSDAVSYFGMSGDRTVSLDGVANDGGPTENDNVLADVENYRGGNGVDLVIGSDGPNDLEGSAGTDILDGAGGPDVLRSSRMDTLKGGAGDDVFVQALDFAGFPADLWFSANETIEGGVGIDTVDYSTRALAVSADSDDQPDDGQIEPFFSGGEGPLQENDNIRPDVERVIGSAGADSLSMDWMSGASGDDRLVDYAGSQRFGGGDGRDLVTYASRGEDIHADADGVAGDDGSSGEGDTLETDVEDLVGGGGNDTLVGNGSANVLDGGPANDEMRGLGGSDTVDYSARTDWVVVDLSDAAAIDGGEDEFDTVDADVENVLGGAGDDLLIGAAQANALDGGGGDDELDGGGGADVLSGGAGFDVASYTQHIAGVVADLDGQSGDDGEPGEGDTLGADVEGLLGGAGSDQLSGNDENNWFDGGPGADQFIGGPGYDLVSYATRTIAVTADPDGSSGDDGESGESDTIGADIEDLDGGAGNDTLRGNGAENFLYGGSGADLLDGGPGEDALFGEDGADELISRDVNADLASCGPGDDLVRPDAMDELQDCERRDDIAGAPPPPPVSTTSPDALAPLVRVGVPRQRLSRVRRSGLRIRVSCSEPCTLTARLRVDAQTAKRLALRHRVLGETRARIATGSKTLTLRLPSAVKKALSRRHSLHATLVISAKDAAGNKRTKRVSVNLR